MIIISWTRSSSSSLVLFTQKESAEGREPAWHLCSSNEPHGFTSEGRNTTGYAGLTAISLMAAIKIKKKLRIEII